MTESEYWQDKHIEFDDGTYMNNGKYICFDETGQYLTSTETIEEAREQLEYYHMYKLNNYTD